MPSVCPALGSLRKRAESPSTPRKIYLAEAYRSYSKATQPHGLLLWLLDPRGGFLP